MGNNKQNKPKEGLLLNNVSSIIETFAEKLMTLDDDMDVEIKLSFIKDIIKLYSRDLYSSDNMDLFVFLYEQKEKIYFYDKLKKNYIPMKAKDAKLLYNKTINMPLNRSMFVITRRKNEYVKKKGKQL